MIRAQGSGQLIAVVYAVLLGENNGIGPNQRLSGLDGRGVLKHLDVEKHQVLRSGLGGVFHGFARGGEGAVIGAFHLQTVLLNRRQVGAAGYKSYVMPITGQKPAKITAHSPGSHNPNLHP